MRTYFRTESLEKFILLAGGAALIVPAFYAPWFLYPYIFGRAIFFQLIVEAMAVAWILLIARRSERYRPRWQPFGIALAIFLAISFLASLLGVDPGRSIWSTELRMTGWFTLSHAFLYFLILSSVVSAERDWRRLFSASSVIIAVMTIIAFAERLSPAFRAAIYGGERVQSTTGNPIYLASVLLFGISFAIFLALSSNGKKRIAWISLVAAETVALFFTETRGAILAAVIAGVIVLIILAIAGSKQKIPLAAVAILVILVSLGGGLYLARDSAFLKRVPPLWRLAQTNLASGTSATRLITWQIAVDGIKARPILGWGPENFNVVFDRFYRPELLRHGFYETVSDKPHNNLLEIGVGSGLPGLLSYLAVFVLLAAALVRGVWSKKIDLVSAAVLVGGLLAYQIQNLFAMDTPNTLVLLVFVLAYFHYKLVPLSVETVRGPSSAQAPKAALALFAALFLPFIYIGNFAPLSSSWEAGQAQDVAGKDAVLWKDPALAALRAGGPYAREMRTIMTRDFLNWEGRGDMPPNVVKDVLDSFIAEMRKSTASRTVTFQERFMLAQLFIMRGEYFKDSQAYVDAEAELLSAAALSPERQAVPFLLGRLYIMTDRPAEATQVLGEVLAKDPSIAEAHWFYGLGLIATGRRSEGVAELEESQRRGRGLTKPNEIQYMIDIYAEDEEYEKLIPLYQDLLTKNPENASWHASLAATYAKLGNNALAILEAQRAAELDPTFAEAARDFIRSLSP